MPPPACAGIDAALVFRTDVKFPLIRLAWLLACLVNAIGHRPSSLFGQCYTPYTISISCLIQEVEAGPWPQSQLWPNVAPWRVLIFDKFDKFDKCVDMCVHMSIYTSMHMSIKMSVRKSIHMYCTRQLVDHILCLHGVVGAGVPRLNH